MACFLAVIVFLASVASGDASIFSRSISKHVKLNGLHERELTRRSTIRKPLTDKREYTETTFDSGLTVLTVVDPEAEKSAFAVAVDAGSYEDPPDFQGLAHFCEHMLFLGSTKYPDKEAFSNQLALYDGNHNAFTSAEQTVYYNEIGNEGLDKGLDIFAQFFISPSFKAEMVDKEIHAVDSEHMKYKPDTQRRLWHLLWSLANPENPAHQFATGDLKTLKTRPEKEGKSLVEALKAFHKKNYCVNRLHLVLIANKTSDELLGLAHQHFDGLPKATAESCTPRPTYVDKTPYTKELGNLGRQLTMSTPGSPSMWLFFPMPDLKTHYKAQAEAYVGHALGHYGTGGLKALLQAEDLSHSFSYYAHSTVAGSAFIMTFSLTEKGAKNPEKIQEHLFAYLNAVKKAGVNPDIITNMKQLRQVMFDYQEKQTSAFKFASHLAGSTGNFPPEDLLTGGVLIDQPDLDLTKLVLEKLSPNNMNVALVDPTFDEKTANSHEEYYDFDYSNIALDSSVLAKLQASTDSRLAPPPDLQFVPRKLDIIEEGAGEDGPKQLVKQGRLEAWWNGMGEARLPKAIIQMKIGYSPKIMSSVGDSILAGLHTRLVNHALEKPSDALQTCGISYSVSTTSDGLGINFMGFDEHILELVKLVLPIIRNPQYTADVFEMLRRQTLLDLSDVTKAEPYQHALEAFELVTVSGHYSRNELIRTIKDVTLVSPASHASFLGELFREAEIAVLFTGNINQERSQEMTKSIESLLSITRDQSSLQFNGKLAVLNPKEEVEVRLPNPIPNDPNSATLVTYQFGVPTIADRIHMSMLGSIIDRPVFETLRTEHQLGYVVFGYVTPHVSITEVRVLVQGFRENPDDVEELIESTIQNLTSTIGALDQKEFEMRKHSLNVQLSKKDMTMSAFAGRNWGQIWEKTYCFNKKELLLKYLNSDKFQSPAPLLEAWKRTVAPGAGVNRKKVTVKLFGQSQSPNATVPTALKYAAKNSKFLLNRDTLGTKVLTLTDSEAVKKRMAGEGVWPDEYICQA